MKRPSTTQGLRSQSRARRPTCNGSSNGSCHGSRSCRSPRVLLGGGHVGMWAGMLVRAEAPPLRLFAGWKAVCCPSASRLFAAPIQRPYSVDSSVDSS